MRYLNVSEISSYIGQSYWGCLQPFDRLWRRCDPDNYTRAVEYLCQQSTQVFEKIDSATTKLEDLEKQLEKTPDDQVLLNLQATKVLQKKKLEDDLEILNDAIDETLLTETQRMQKILGISAVDLVTQGKESPDEKKVLIKSIIDKLEVKDSKKREKIEKATESFINKSHGILTEDSAIGMFEERFSVKLDTSQEYHKKMFKTGWYIGGKVDGLYISQDPNESYIVEVKNRTKGFFNSLRDYENTQIQLYMYILDIQSARLVERYKNQLRITSIIRDEDYIQEIVACMCLLTQKVEEEFLDKIEVQYKYIELQDDEKKLFLQDLFINPIIEMVKRRFLPDDEIDSNQECIISDNSDDNQNEEDSSNSSNSGDELD